MLVYHKPFGGVIPKWFSISEIFDGWQLQAQPLGDTLRRLGMAGCSLCKARHSITIGIITFLEEQVQIEFNDEMFLKIKISR